MNTIDIAKVKFIGFFVASICLCIIIFSSFWRPPAEISRQEMKLVSNENISETRQLLSVDQLLHSKWSHLEQLYSGYLVILPDAPKTSDNKIGGRIAEAEQSFNKILDSIAGNSSSLPAKGKIDSVITSFRLALKNNQSYNAIILESKKNNDKGGMFQQMIQNLQNDLQVKNATITNLQSQLKTPAVPATGDRILPVKENKKMKDEIEFLKWALRSEVSSNHTLTNNNKLLKQEIANLSRQMKQ